MILRASEIEAPEGRRPYDLEGRDIRLGHFVTRVTTPHTPFGPHAHAERELWFILEGQAIVSLEGVEHTLGPRDMAVIDPWVKHGLRTDSEATWICLG